MKIEKTENDIILEMQRKIRGVIIDDDEFMCVFSTLLGAADNVAQYVLEKERGNYDELPYRCKYGLLMIYQMLTLLGKICRDEISSDDFNIGGYLPTGEGAWRSEKDFEKRFILMIKMFYKQLEKEGKI